MLVKSSVLIFISCILMAVRQNEQKKPWFVQFLEYACPVWSPHLTKDIHEIKKVQRRPSKIALHQRRQEMAYEERCKILKWNSLVQRRHFLSLVECYKIVFNLNGLNFELCRNTKLRSNHPYKLQTKLAKLNYYKKILSFPELSNLGTIFLLMYSTFVTVLKLVILN